MRFPHLKKPNLLRLRGYKCERHWKKLGRGAAISNDTQPIQVGKAGEAFACPLAARQTRQGCASVWVAS